MIRQPLAEQCCHNYIIMLLRSLRFCLSRKEKRSFGYDEITEYKLQRLTKYLSRYSSEEKYQHEDKLYEEFVYGHSCHIAAVTQHSFDSQRLAKTIMKQAPPNLLILGGLSDNYLRAGEMQFRIRNKYEHPLSRPEKMMCRERLGKLIQTRLECDRNFHWDDKRQEMLVLNHKDRRILPAGYLTAAHIASLQGDTKIVLGKPSDNLVFEDLIMRYSLQQLQEVVQRAAERVRAAQGEEVAWRESYTLEAIQNYVMSEEPAIYSRELTYQTALLKRFAKIEDKIVLMTPGYFVERIAEQVHHIEVKPESVFRDGITDRNSESYALLQKTLRCNPEEILEKFALVCLLKENWIEQ